MFAFMLALFLFCLRMLGLRLFAALRREQEIAPARRLQSYFSQEHARDGADILKKRLEAKRWLRYAQRPYLGKLRHRSALTQLNEARRLPPIDHTVSAKRG